MSRRLEVELTSRRDDGTWTWRAAGAREPKGVLSGDLLYDGVAEGDVVRVDAEFDLDGIEVVAVLPPKSKRKEPERLELLGGTFEAGVTTQLAKGGRRRRDDDGEDRGRGRGRRRDGDRPREGGDGRRERRPRGERRDRPEPPPLPEKPKPKRLRPGRTHRNEWVAGLAEEQRPVAEQLVRGGLPAVRKAVETEVQRAKEEGRPSPNEAALVGMAEQLLPGLRVAEWLDRADAALADLDEIDLRDLRSVVVAAESVGRDATAKEKADQLRAGLNARVESEHQIWLDEVRQLLADGRIVRALRVSSRPPKAGAPFPRELADSMAEQAAAAMGPEVSQQRWGAVLEAVAYSPVRGAVQPAAVPSSPNEELLTSVRKVASRVPEIAAQLGVTPSARKRRGPRKPPPPPPSEAPAAPEAAEAPAASEAAEAATTEASAAPEAPEVTETPAAPEAPEAPEGPEATETEDRPEVS